MITNQNFDDKVIYSFEEDTKAVAFVDIIGFSNLTSQGNGKKDNYALYAMTFFENAILRYRNEMRKSSSREVKVNIDQKEYEYKRDYVWYKNINEGSVNFAYMSDCAVLYSNSLTKLFDILSAIFGAAVVFGVPLRAGISMGSIHHSEWVERPGTGITLYGSGLTKAVKLEESVSGCGMKVLVDNEVRIFANEINLGNKIGICSEEGPSELKWWLNAFDKKENLLESDQLKDSFDRWFSTLSIKNWFTGSNCTNTKINIQNAIDELKSMNR